MSNKLHHFLYTSQIPHLLTGFNNCWTWSYFD